MLSSNNNKYQVRLYNIILSNTDLTGYNDFFMHMLQPLSKTSVLTYSDAKNVLTGVLGN